MCFCLVQGFLYIYGVLVCLGKCRSMVANQRQLFIIVSDWGSYLVCHFPFWFCGLLSMCRCMSARVFIASRSFCYLCFLFSVLRLNKEEYIQITLSLCLLTMTNVTSVELRDRIVLRNRSGEGNQNISAALKVTNNTVASIILKWNMFGITKTLPRAGRQAKLSNRRRTLVREVAKKPMVTLTEL